jgi:hypothetical protein
LMTPGARAAVLWIGIIFCIGLLGMTAVVVADSEIERWTFGWLLMVGFIVGGVVLILLVLLALISALRNPPPD